MIALIRTIYSCELVPEDFLFFVSYEFNTVTQMQPLIHNYALTYALARQFHVGWTGTTPRYEELSRFENYATPARPVVDPRYVTHTYNSVCTRTNVTQSPLNVPSLGRNRKIMPASTRFEFLVFSKGGDLPPYVRIGKKLCISRLRASRLKIVDTVLEPSETVEVNTYYNLMDLSPNDVVSSFDMIRMFPSPIARRMTVRAPHFVLEREGEQFAVPIPRHLREEEG